MCAARRGDGEEKGAVAAQGSARGRRVRRIGALLAVVFLGVLPRSARGGQFHPNKSTSFINEEQLFKVEYLDDASLTGFVAEDIVQLGDYYVSTRFGCVTKSKGHDWAQADGILGMGFPAAALRSVPFPLFWALTDTTKVQLDNSNILLNRIFTLMLSQDRGELVLGGHDPKSVKGGMVTTNVRASALADGSEAFMHYMIDVQSLKVGGHELLQFKDKSIAIQAILDSGTSCLVVPDDTFGGGLLASPFKTFQKHFGDLDEPMIEITIEGKTFSLPYDDYMVDDKPCVMKMKSTPRTFLLGDVFFRRMVVVHNLNDPMRPQITLGERHPDYRLTAVTKKVDDRSHIPLGKKAVQRPMPETEHAVPAAEGARVRAGTSWVGAQGTVGAAYSPPPQQMYQPQPMIQQQQQSFPGGNPQQWGIAQQTAAPAAYAGPVAINGNSIPMYQQPPAAEQRQMEPMPQQQQQQQQQQAMVPEYMMNQPHFSQPYQIVSSAGEHLQGKTAGAGGAAGAPQYQIETSSGEQDQSAISGGQAAGPAAGADEPPPLHNPSAGRRLLGATEEVERIGMTTSNSYIYYVSLEVGSPRQKNIHAILDTGSSVFAIFAVPHGGPSVLVICLLVAACLLGATSIGLLALSWYQGTYEEMAEGMDPLGDGLVIGEPLLRDTDMT